MVEDSGTTDDGGTGGLAIDVRNLTFSYDQSDKPSLSNLSLQLSKGSRCLLIGSNGAGKSTFLSILGGKRLCVQNEDINVLGKHPYYDTSLNLVRSYLDIDWGMRTVSYTGYGLPLQADIAVKDMMQKLQDSYPARRDELIELMAIDPEWRMHQLSEGQRRRVQILIGLVRPFDILLLDEVTSSLDLVVRQDLLDWLHNESMKRNATIIYATHIFDGMEEWPTHVQYMKHDGTTGWQGTFEELNLYRHLCVKGRYLLTFVLMKLTSSLLTPNSKVNVGRPMVYILFNLLTIPFFLFFRGCSTRYVCVPPCQ
eukprot:138828_1